MSFLAGKSLNWARSIKYLGMELMASSSFDTDLDQTRRKFYVSVNTILRHCSGASELMKLYLCESYCLQVLMYAVESLNLCTTAVRKLNVYWNSVYRKIFSYKPWESVREVMKCLGKKNFEFMYYERKLCM